MSRWRFVEVEKAAFPIALLCRVLGVSCTGYFAWRAALRAKVMRVGRKRVAHLMREARL